MQKLKVGDFLELSEQEMYDTDGGNCLIPGLIVMVGGIVAIYEIGATAVENGNKREVDNGQRESCPIISIHGNIDARKSGWSSNGQNSRGDRDFPVYYGVNQPYGHGVVK